MTKIKAFHVYALPSLSGNSRTLNVVNVRSMRYTHTQAHKNIHTYIYGSISACNRGTTLREARSLCGHLCVFVKA